MCVVKVNPLLPNLTDKFKVVCFDSNPFSHKMQLNRDVYIHIIYLSLAVASQG